jgi:hypothetical protein
MAYSKWDIEKKKMIKEQWDVTKDVETLQDLLSQLSDYEYSQEEIADRKKPAPRVTATDDMAKPAPRVTATDDMAQRIMDVLCENGQGDFLLLRDDEIREWWESVTKERKLIQRQEAERRRRAEVRERALNKLTAEERKILGIK